MTWAAPWIAVLHHQPHNHSLGPFDQLAYTKTFHSIAARATLGLEPYSLRHGGASHDALTGHRNLAQIKSADGGVQNAQSNVTKGNTCPPTNRHARSRIGGPRTDHRKKHCSHDQHDSNATRRRCWQITCEQCLRSQTTSYVSRILPRTDLVGTQAHCRSTSPADRSLAPNFPTRRLEGRQNDTCDPVGLFRSRCGCAHNIDRLACAHHVLLIIILPSNPGATRSTVHAGRRVFRISTRHVPWNCSITFSSLGALVCYVAERLNLACDEQHLRRLSQLAGIVNGHGGSR